MKFLSATTLCAFIFFSSPIYAAEAATDVAALTSAHASQAKQTMDYNHIIAWFMVLNKNEIAASKAVVDKTQNEQVKEYAQMMIDQHTKNLDAVIALSKKIKMKPIDDAAVKSLRTQGKQGVKKLDSLNGPALDIAYINAMVAGHTDALQHIDNNIMKKVHNDDLKAYVTDTRGHVEMHLEKAKAIQAELKNT